MPDFTIAIAILKKPLEDLYVIATGAFRGQIATLKAQSRVKKLHKRLWESQRVKTIWHTDKPLSLTSFFYPVTVLMSSLAGGKSIKVNGLEDLPDQHTIIFGTVGQGKSILLRFLLGRELKSGIHIPLLCELRNVESQTLFDYLSGRFALLLEMANDENLFTFFAKNGKIAFLLDGFDEILPQNIPKISQELEDLATRFPNCRIALTSRPDSECRHLTSFHTVRIAELTAADLTPFYRKIGHDIDFATRIVAAITRSPTKIRELIVTPLLATLLAISYRAAQRIPLEFAEFYEVLFQILLVRHDAAKLGWKRARKATLNDRDFQQVFEAFCFLTRKRRITAIDAEDALQITRDALDSLKLAADPQHVIDDIRRITCLLVEEGAKLQFVHNSVQEFFSARYIKTRTEAVAASFYGQILGSGKWMRWQEELLFLKQIDNHRATKYFFLPDLKITLTLLVNTAISVTPELSTAYLNNMAVKKSIVNKEGRDVTTFAVHRIRTGQTYHIQILDSRVFAKLFGGSPWNTGFISEPTSVQRTYLQIAKDKGGSELESLLELVGSVISAQQTEYHLDTKRVIDEENIKGLTDLTGI